MNTVCTLGLSCWQIQGLPLKRCCLYIACEGCLHLEFNSIYITVQLVSKAFFRDPEENIINYS